LRNLLVFTATIAITLTIPSGSLRAQSLEEGYRAAVRNLPSGTGSTLVLEASRVVYFTGTRLVLDDGVAPRDLLVLPASVFGSFTIQVGPSTLLFGENSTGALWLVPLSGNPRQLGSLTLNYDAVAWTSGLALVSAKTGGFASPNSEVWAVDLSTGALDLVAELPGASGPTVLEPSGDLLYATATMTYPPPVGSSKVVRFARAKLLSALGPTKLTLVDASVAFAGLDAAGDLALDSDGDLFVTDWWNSRIVEIDDIDRPAPRATWLSEQGASAFSASSLHFLPGRSGTQAKFEPFQPESGAALVIHEVDYVSGGSRLRTIAPARPVLGVGSANPIPPGPVTLEVRGGPANSIGLLVFGWAGAQGERTIDLRGAEQPIFWSMALTPGLEVAAFPLTLDASGQARVNFTNPGGTGWKLVAQTAIANVPAAVFGSTPPAILELR